MLGPTIVTHPAEAAGNPCLDAWQRARDGHRSPSRDELVERFGFAVPDEPALQAIIDHSPDGVVEIGAGLGYWAHLLADRGADVVAYDIAPPPSPDNTWFAGREPWFPVAAGDERVVAAHATRTLLLVWPTRNEDWGADAVLQHGSGGGQRLVYVGEPPGGRTGDSRLHAALGLTGRCLACTYTVMDAACTCGVIASWRLIEEMPLPSWDGGDDRLHLFEPAPVTKRRWRLPGDIRRSRTNR